MDDQLFSLLEQAARTWPDKVALVKGNCRLNFSELKRAADRLAQEFRYAAIEPGDKVGLLCPNGPEYVIGSFALFSINAVVVPIFPGLKELEIAALHKDLCLDGICSSPEFEETLPPIFGSHPHRFALQVSEIAFHIRKIDRAAAERSRDREIWGETAPLIRFTSGTTSEAKGVMIPQFAMLEYTRRFVEAYGIKKGDSILNLLSMAHIFYPVTAPMLCGAKLIVADAGDIGAIGDILRAERVTHIEAAPSFYSMGLTADDWDAEQFRSVRFITSCGAPLADKVAGAFRKRFGREIVQRYGLTETGPVLINTTEDESKRGSLGVAAPNCEVRLRSQGEMPSPERAELQIQCAGLFTGYYSPWTPRSEVVDDGWFRTGDLARRDADGFYWMTGRVKTMINVGAVKVFPSELENILLTDPAVNEAHVYAAADARFGEVPHARVVLRPGAARSEKELLQFVNRSLSVFKAVRRIEIVSRLTKTQTGKIKRYESTET